MKKTVFIVRCHSISRIIQTIDSIIRNELLCINGNNLNIITLNFKTWVYSNKNKFLAELTRQEYALYLDEYKQYRSSLIQNNNSADVLIMISRFKSTAAVLEMIDKIKKANWDCVVIDVRKIINGPLPKFKIIHRKTKRVIKNEIEMIVSDTGDYRVL